MFHNRPKNSQLRLSRGRRASLLGGLYLCFSFLLPEAFPIVKEILTSKRDPLSDSLEGQPDHLEFVSQADRLGMLTRLDFRLEEPYQHPRSQEPRKARDGVEQCDIEARRTQDVDQVEDLPSGKEELLRRLAKRRRGIRVRIMQKDRRPINRNTSRK